MPLYSWGWGGDYRLGNGSTSTVATPTPALNGPWAKVSAGERHSAGIKADGTLWAWGFNYQGQLGQGSSWWDATNGVYQVGTDNDWSDVEAGSNATVAIRSDGTLWTCGELYKTGHLVEHWTMTKVGTRTDWAKIATSTIGLFCLTTGGQLWACGEGRFGRLGNNSTVTVQALTQIGSAAWSQVTGYSSRSAGIQLDGSLWVWGRNDGKLGLGADTAHKLIPTQLSSEAWLDVCSLSDCFIALKANHTLWSFGYNTFGALGLGSGVTSASVPTQIGTGLWNQISAGGSRCVAVNVDHEIYVWGDNANGALGLGDSTNRWVPTRLAPYYKV